jgi:RHS repeat-associated protein
MKITPSGIEYMLTDTMGSTIAKANVAGTATASIRYDAFGNITSAVGPSAPIDSSIGVEPRFQGMQLDQSTALYFVRARTYDARSGRFLSKDPVPGFRLEPESMNPYVLCYNNTQLWRDPTGEFSLMEAMATQVAVGVLFSTALPAYQGFLLRAQGYRNGWNATANQSATDLSAGIGDTLSFGIGKAIRNAGQDLGWWSDGADETSASYDTGVAVGFVMSIISGGAAGGATGAAAVGATESAVIGRYPAYVKLGEGFGYNTFDLPKPVYAAFKAGGLDWWLNQQWLDIQIKAGAQFALASDLKLAEAGTGFAKEVAYLLRAGYRLAGDGKAGSFLVPP